MLHKGPKSKNQDLKSKIENPRPKFQDPKSSSKIENPGPVGASQSELPHSVGFRVLNFGLRILDFGFWGGPRECTTRQFSEWLGVRGSNRRRVRVSFFLAGKLQLGKLQLGKLQLGNLQLGKLHQFSWANFSWASFSWANFGELDHFRGFGGWAGSLLGALKLSWITFKCAEDWAHLKVLETLLWHRFSYPTSGQGIAPGSAATGASLF